MNLSVNKHQGKVPYAFSKTLNRNVGVDEVERGKDCNCICINCRMSVVSKKGDQNVHHFAHRENAETSCDYSYWVSVRDIAAQVLNKAKYIKYDGVLANCYNIPFSNSLKYIEIYHEVTLKKKQGMDIYFSTNMGLLGVYFLTQEKDRENYFHPYIYSQNLTLVIDLKSIIDNSIYTIDSLRNMLLHGYEMVRFASYPTNKKELVSTIDFRTSFNYKTLYSSSSIMQMSEFYSFGIKPSIINTFEQSDFSAINVAKVYYLGAYKLFGNSKTTSDYEELSRDELHSFILCQNEYYATAFIINKFYVYQVTDDELTVIGKCFKKDEIEQIIKSHVATSKEGVLHKEIPQEKYPTLF